MREEVRKAIQSLRASADLVFGDPDRVDVVGADADRGAFLGPVLLRADATAVEPHDVEAFGPVSTVIGYDGLDQAVALAARGRGSLAGSVVTHDPDVARTVTLGLAPWHGRILVLDRDCAAICRLASQLMASGSRFAAEACALCARICEACARECEKHQAEHCQACAKACRDCAQECQKMAA